MATNIMEALQKLNENQLKEGLDKSYVDNGLHFAYEILTKLTPEECEHWFYDEYTFDQKGPEDEVEKVIYFALKSRIGLDESFYEGYKGMKRGKTHISKARMAKLNKELADTTDESSKEDDNKYNKNKLEKSYKSAALSIEDAQKWVDFDMERYARISKRTNDLVKKAGFQIVKDDHGDYEVIAGDYED